MTKTASRILWITALLILAAALVCFNLPPAGGSVSDAPAAETYISDAPIGCDVGEQLPDFTLTQTDGSEFRLSDHRGTVTVLNLWATWCTPCVNELPHFDRLQQTYPDNVTVLAIHSDLITDDVDAYLAGYDYTIAFAVDTTGEVISSVGGSTMLPQTVILDPYGQVTYNKVGSVTYEALEELTLAAMP